MARIFGVVAALVALLWGASPATAQRPSAVPADGPVRLTADSVAFDAKRGIYEASHSVVIRQGKRTIRADWLIFNKASGQGVASGRVTVTEGDDTLHASFMEFNVNTTQGVVFDGYLDSQGSGFEMRGEEIVKTGDTTYTFRDGTFTACDCAEEEAREPWQIAAREADVELGGYATARNASFDVLGVPFLWLPWAMVPIKTERQTGFLLPDFAVGDTNGFELGLPFFWAAADPLNVTATPRWLSDRGFKGDLDLEYVVGNRSRGSLFGSVLADGKIDPDSGATPFGKTRWSVLGLQDFFLPGDVRFKADFAFVSDNHYLRDFDELRTRRSFRFLQSTAFATKPLLASGRIGLIATLRFADDLQNPDDRDRDAFLLQRQSAALVALPAPLEVAPWIAPALDVNYSWFGQRSRDYRAGFESGTTRDVTRADGVFVDSGIDGLPNGLERIDGNFTDFHLDDFDPAAPGGPEANGLFDEGEVLADRGHRIDLWPRVGFPVQVADRLELYPEVGWRETFYQSVERDFEVRGMFTALVDLRTRLERRYGEDLLHLLEPRLGYALVRAPGQSGNPLFVPDTRVPQQRLRHLQLENIVADSADRVADFNGLVVGFGNKLYRHPRGRAPILLGDFEVSSQINFETGRRRADWEVADERFAPIYLDGRLFPAPGIETNFSVGIDPERAEVSEGLAELWLRHPFGHSLSFQYRYLRDIPVFYEDFARQNERFENFASLQTVSQASGSTRLAFTRQWSATYSFVYSFDLAELIVQQGGVHYFSRCRCWGLGFAVSDSRNRDVQFNVLYQIIGLGGARGAGSNVLGRLGLLDGF